MTTDPIAPPIAASPEQPEDEDSDKTPAWNTCPKCEELVDAPDAPDGGEVHCRACDTCLTVVEYTDGSWGLLNPEDHREELHDKNADVRLIIKPDADSAEVLAACVKLLEEYFGRDFNAPSAPAEVA